jgi:hypothetical protein
MFAGQAADVNEMAAAEYTLDQFMIIGAQREYE